MYEVAARSIGAVAGDPVLLAQLGLVLAVPHHVLPQLVVTVRELAEVAVKAGPLLLEVAADLCLEPGVDVDAAVGLVDVVLAPVAPVLVLLLLLHVIQAIGQKALIRGLLERAQLQEFLGKLPRQLFVQPRAPHPPLFRRRRR